MNPPNFLDLGNPRKVKAHLEDILDQDALDLIEQEIQRNSIDLYNLGLHHYRFAVRLPSNYWRQKVSRFYYAAYAVSRSIRLYVNGYHSTDVKDHQRIGELPDGFPQNNRFSNKLSILREDRNTCDYDHESRASDLLISSSDAAELVKDFLIEAKKYLDGRGLHIRGRL